MTRWSKMEQKILQIIKQTEKDIENSISIIPKSTPELSLYYEGKFNGLILALSLTGQISLPEYVRYLNENEKRFDNFREELKKRW